MDYSEVPDFYGDGLRRGDQGQQRVWNEIQSWLMERGMYAVEIVLAQTTLGAPLPDGILMIASGKSPRNPEWDHSVIAKYNRREGKFETFHDPHKSKDGIKEVTVITLLCKMP